MKNVLLLTLLSTFGLAACDRGAPVVVNPPPVTVTVPGPAGPAGPAGATGAAGVQGNTGGTGMTGGQGEEGKAGKTGGNTTVIVEPAPPAPAPSN